MPLGCRGQLVSLWPLLISMVSIGCVHVLVKCVLSSKRTEKRKRERSALQRFKLGCRETTFAMISKKEEILVKLLALLCILTPSQGFFIFYFIGSYVLLVVVSNNIIIDHACIVVFFFYSIILFLIVMTKQPTNQWQIGIANTSSLSAFQ